MIKPSELRIGNYFHPISTANGISLPATGVIFQVGSINKFGDVEVIEPDYETKEFRASELSPISLTEEWLVKLGFIKDRVPNCYCLGDFVIFTKNEANDIKSPYVSFGFRSVIVPLHVHRLQNLYHALMGEELEIKEIV